MTQSNAQNQGTPEVPRRQAGFHPSIDRFNAFSDGVFAIAFTLLVLELPVPSTSAPVVPALLKLWPNFLGCFISFAFIGGIWLVHSSLTRLMKRGDFVAYGANLLLLILVAILPYATSLMVTHLSGPDASISVALYGVNVLLASLTLSLLIYYVARDRTLLADDITDKTLRGIARERWISIAVGIVAVVTALFVPLVAVALYLIQTLLLLFFPLAAMRRSRRRVA